MASSCGGSRPEHHLLRYGGFLEDLGGGFLEDLGAEM